MRIIISDKEWYYGRYLIGVLLIFISVGGGVFMYFRNSKEEANKATIIENIPISNLSEKGSNYEPINSSKDNSQQFTTSKSTSSPSEIVERPQEKSQDGKNIQDLSNEQTKEMIGVAIQGAVKKPGMYWLQPNSRVQTIIDLAGGPLPNAELRYINLAAPLIDGTTVVIPEKTKVIKDGRFVSVKGPTQPTGYIYSSEYNNYSTPYVTPNSYATKSSNIENSNIENPVNELQYSSNLININTATQKELESLPGIGPVLANSIIEYRKTKPFKSIDELLNVPGIGTKRFEKIRELVTVSQ